jgi:hypothetical protein
VHTFSRIIRRTCARIILPQITAEKVADKAQIFGFASMQAIEIIMAFSEPYHLPGSD